MKAIHSRPATHRESTSHNTAATRALTHANTKAAFRMVAFFFKSRSI